MQVNSEGLFRQHKSSIMTLQRLLDPLLSILILRLLTDYFHVLFFTPYILLCSFIALLIFVIFFRFNLYRSWRGATLFAEIRALVGAWLLVMSFLLLFGYATKTSIYFSRSILLLYAITTPVVLIAVRIPFRFFLRYLRIHGRNSISVVIVGAGDLGKKLANRIKNAPWMGMHVVGFFDDSQAGKIDKIEGIPILGTLETVPDFCRQKKADSVYLALPFRAEKKMRALVSALENTTCSIYIIPDIFIFSLIQTRIDDLDGLPIFSISESPLWGIDGWSKRLADLILSTLILLITSPLFLIIALLIKSTSKGPVFFQQKRYGLNGEEILVYKFRTMSVCENGTHVTQAKKMDPRITSTGSVLRRSSLDELPQFFNVLKGDMSVVGPRPHAVAHNEYYRNLIKGYMLRHKVKPGITGWAQINGWRGETETLDKMKKRVECDLEYIGKWSLWLDFKIIIITLFKGFSGKNAY